LIVKGSIHVAQLAAANDSPQHVTHDAVPRTCEIPFLRRWNLCHLFGIALDWSKFALWLGTICCDCFTWSSSFAV